MHPAANAKGWYDLLILENLQGNCPCCIVGIVKRKEKSRRGRVRAIAKREWEDRRELR